MSPNDALTKIVDAPPLNAVADPLRNAVLAAYEAAGPATQDQPVFDVRERSGNIEVKGR